MSETTIEPMTDDEINIMLAELDLQAKILGFTDWYEFETDTYHAAEGMIRFGGSFTHFLGEALAHADSKNARKIFLTFKEEWHHHAELHQKFIKKRAELQREEESE